MYCEKSLLAMPKTIKVIINILLLWRVCVCGSN